MARQKEQLEVENNEPKKILGDFLKNIGCLNQLNEYTSSCNVLDVFGFAKNEIRHSFVLKWLLDPCQSHGLGDLYLKTLLKKIVPTTNSWFFDIALMDCSDFVVERERNNIDLFLYSEQNKCVIAIENKIGSHEHGTRVNGQEYGSQLTKYYRYVEKNYSSYQRKLYFYLSPNGEEPSDKAEGDWVVITYEDIVSTLEEIFALKRDAIEPHAKLLIENYIEILRRDIVDNPELNKICEKIYQQNKAALDLIYKHSSLGMNYTELIVSKALSELMEENKVEYNSEGKNKNQFHTKQMNEFLPSLGGELGSWKQGFTYIYWFKIDDEEERVSLVFELGYKDIDQETKTKFDTFCKILHPKKASESAKYKRVETYSWVELENMDEQQKIEKIKNEVKDKILDHEVDWINKCKDAIEKQSQQ